MAEFNTNKTLQGLLKETYSSGSIAKKPKKVEYKAPHAAKSSFSLLKKILQK